MKDLKKKGILMLVSGLLLVCVLLYSSFAWYTKMTSVHSLVFNLAKWDFNANYQQDSFKVNVYEYSQINSQKAAPGTRGYIPLQLSANRSDADVDYTITVDSSTMSPEFQNRIYFYYLDDEDREVVFVAEGEDKTSLIGSLEKNKKEVVNIYWHWLYDYNEYLERNNETDYEMIELLQTLLDKNEDNVERLINNLENALDVPGNTGKDRVFIKTVTETFALTQVERVDLQTYINTYGGQNFSLRSFWTEYCLDENVYKYVQPQDATAEEIIAGNNKQAAAAKVIAIIQRVANENKDNTEILFSNTTAAINGVQLFWLNLKASLTVEERSVIYEYISKHADNGEKYYSLRDFYQAYTTDPTQFDAPLDASEEQIQDAANADAVYAAMQRLKAMDIYNLEILFENVEAALIGDSTDIFWSKSNTYALTQAQKDQIQTFINGKLIGNPTFTFKSFWDSYLEAYEDYDKFDTEAGKNIALYEPLMSATVSIVGVEAVLDTTTTAKK